MFAKTANRVPNRRSISNSRPLRCASSPLATDRTMGSGGGGLLTTTFEMNRSFTFVRNTVRSTRVPRVVHSIPASMDVLRSGFRSGLP